MLALLAFLVACPSAALMPPAMASGIGPGITVRPERAASGL